MAVTSPVKGTPTDLADETKGPGDEVANPPSAGSGPLGIGRDCGAGSPTSTPPDHPVKPVPKGRPVAVPKTEPSLGAAPAPVKQGSVSGSGAGEVRPGVAVAPEPPRILTGAKVKEAPTSVGCVMPVPTAKPPQPGKSRRAGGVPPVAICADPPMDLPGSGASPGQPGGAVIEPEDRAAGQPALQQDPACDLPGPDTASTNEGEGVPTDVVADDSVAAREAAVRPTTR